MHIRFDGFEIGCTHDSGVFISTYEIGETHIDDEDQPRLGADGVVPGRDFQRGTQWVFDLTVHGQDGTGSVLATTEPLIKAWTAWHNRSRGRVPLEYSTDCGATWYRVYGRPRQLVRPHPGAQSKFNGRGKLQPAFFQQDVLHYSVADSSTKVSAVPARPSRGWRAPFRFPLTSGVLSDPVSTELVNAGDQPAPLTVTFGGSVTEPRLRNLQDDVVVGIRGSLAWDERITVDAHAETVELWRTGNPHVRQSVPGRLIRQSRLSRLRANPGRTSWQLRYAAADQGFADLSAPSAFTTMQYNT